MSGELAKALVAAQAEMPAVEPDAVNPHFKSKFVSLGHLIAKTRPVLNKHGLSIVQAPEFWNNGEPSLSTTIYHASGESIRSTMPLFLGGGDMQKLGAAITYARRFAWAAALGISDQEDDDGNQASAPAPGANKPAATPSPAGPDPAAGGTSTPPAAASLEDMAAYLTLAGEVKDMDATFDLDGALEWAKGKDAGKLATASERLRERLAAAVSAAA